ncbi:hypothetical protein MRX96_010390 [Rhipicephalus microplus]
MEAVGDGQSRDSDATLWAHSFWESVGGPAAVAAAADSKQKAIAKQTRGPRSNRSTRRLCRCQVTLLTD